MKILDLFCGTKSVSNYFKAKHHEVVTLDIDKDFNPDICSDILEWDYKVYEPNEFFYIHASPPCVTYSTMGGGKHRTKKDLIPLTPEAINADLILIRLLEILEYFNPTYWTIENPRGLMRYYLTDFNYETVNYCKYGSLFFKPTDIFNNFNFKGLRCKYERKGQTVDCSHMRVKGSHKDRVRGGIQRVSKHERYKIPEKLVEAIFRCISPTIII